MAHKDIAEKRWDGDGVPLEESNVAGIGSDEDKALRKKAAQTEPAWEGVGEEPGLWIWRIESFAVVPWPKEKYGKFHSSDSYIILHVQGGEQDTLLEREVYFWLGETTSIDERGTAAYKTVELDDYFDGACGQHREVQHKESDEFQQVFANLEYLPGGVESGFNPAEPDVYQARLLQVLRTKEEGIKVRVVPVERASLNHRDAFVLDTGAKIWVWHGDAASPFVKHAAGVKAEAIESERAGDAKTTMEIDDDFWALLGGPGDITPADAVHDDAEPDFGEGSLYKVDVGAERQIEVSLVGRGELKSAMLDSTAVMMLDTRTEVFLWYGKDSSEIEKRIALRTAMQYLKTNGRPQDTAIHIFKEGAPIKNKVWTTIFSN